MPDKLRRRLVPWLDN